MVWKWQSAGQCWLIINNNDVEVFMQKVQVQVKSCGHETLSTACFIAINPPETA